MTSPTGIPTIIARAKPTTNASALTAMSCHSRPPRICSRTAVAMSHGVVMKNGSQRISESTREPDPLLHPARQLVGVVTLESGEPDQVDQLGGAPSALGRRHAAQLET